MQLPKRTRNKRLYSVLGGLLGVILLAALGVGIWYAQALKPLDPNNSQTVRITIPEGSSVSDIAVLLQEKKIIKSQLAFSVYARTSGTLDKLRAGLYYLSPSYSVKEIIEHLTAGVTDEFTVTFYPGAVLKDTTSTPEAQKTDVTTMLRRAGFTDAEIEVALNKDYTHPLFATKPASADLEGYVYGETYNFSQGTSAEEVLERTFDEMYAAIKKHDLINAYKKEGLSLYEGITLASIIEREEPDPETRKQIAQVFFTRMSQGMELGSDPTYQYAARKMGVAPTPELDSPYNTRRFEGLPPGPISAPGLSALLAVAHPAKGDYLYFLSGDDDVTYFAHTFAQHEENIQKHCQIKCSTY